MNKWPMIILNVALFDLLWTLAVVGAGKTWWWCAPVLILVSAAAQLRWSPSPMREAAVIVVGAAVGVSLDVVAHELGLFVFTSASRMEFVIVFVALWINFGTTLRPSLTWLWNRPFAGALLGGLGGPLAYWVAARLGAIAPVAPGWRAYAWCGVQFGVAVPLWIMAISRALSAFPGSTRPTSPRSSPQTQGTPEW